jgi:Flp pilus assembly protein TadD
MAPGFPSGYGVRALCRADAGELDGALSDADTAIELGRVDAWAFFARGSIYLERGEVANGRADLQKALTLAPTPEFVGLVRSPLAEHGLE